jgi:hypothetical protein
MSPAKNTCQLGCSLVKSTDTEEGQLAREDGEDSWNWWHVNPFVIVLAESSCTLFPVLDGLLLNGRTDK